MQNRGALVAGLQKKRGSNPKTATSSRRYPVSVRERTRELLLVADLALFFEELAESVVNLGTQGSVVLADERRVARLGGIHRIGKQIVAHENGLLHHLENFLLFQRLETDSYITVKFGYSFILALLFCSSILRRRSAAAIAIASAAASSSAVIRAICSSGLSPGLRCNCSADTPTGEPAGGSGIPPAFPRFTDGSSSRALPPPLPMLPNNPANAER